ncbi:hypothetical protein MIND_00412000 [Mycena indigotica]|uniref:MYND-type domain-containing protein n=1 Tax=Mycena indigotica TaxID=2126181 RepID=A0A8H6SU51_9AGAR|nr:uncharacterized protein MIND_00412000 [Mycena indigotica]KAF7306215.1 hypothetical protein MIND_00412000 [Mycena indigotica]
MHDAFEQRHLNRLPARFRSIARLLATSSEPHDFAQFEALIHADPRSHILLLPLYWIFLDPARIPPPTALESPSPLEGFALHAAFLALSGSAKAMEVQRRLDHAQWFHGDQVQLPYRELWPRLWRWACFVQQNWALIPASYCHKHSCNESSIIASLLRFTVTAFNIHSPNDANFAIREPGFLRVVFRHWSLRLAQSSDRIPEDLDLSCAFLNLPRGSLDEIISGVGGSLNDVARLFASHIRIYAKELERRPLRARWSPADRVFTQIRGTIGSINNLVPGHAPESATRAQPGPFIEIFLSYLNPRTLVRMAHRLVAYDTSRYTSGEIYGWGTVMRDAIFILGLLLIRSRRSVRIALRHELISVLVRASSRDDGRKPESVADAVNDIIKEVLCPATLFSSINQLLQTSFADIHQLLSSTQFLNSPSQKYSSQLLDMVQVNSLPQVAARALNQANYGICNSSKCLKIANKAQLRRCANCRVSLYCSSDCQRFDWRQGMHRATCLTFLVTAQATALRFSLPELADMHAAMTYHHQNHTAGYYFAIAMHTIGRTTPTPYFVVVDFANHNWQRGIGPLVFALSAVTVDSDSPLTEIREYFPAGAMDAWLARAEECSDRMELHVLRFAIGNAAQFVVMPFCFSGDRQFLIDTGRDFLRQEEQKSGGVTLEGFRRRWESVKVPEDFQWFYQKAF